MITVQLAARAVHRAAAADAGDLRGGGGARDGVHFHFLETEGSSYLRDELKMTPKEYLESSGILAAPYGILAHCVWLMRRPWALLIFPEWRSPITPTAT